MCGLCRLGANGFDAAYTFGAYEGELRKLIQVFKYGGVQPLSKPLGAFLSTALPRGERFDVIVPMPLHWRKRWTRGFNQAELLGRELSRRSGIPLRRAVRRARFTAVQAGLTHAGRRKNVAGAFQTRGNGLRGLRVLLIDDVMTTGATASACAKALKRGGAAHVSLLTLARVDRRWSFVTDSDSRSLDDAQSRSTA